MSMEKLKSITEGLRNLMQEIEDKDNVSSLTIQVLFNESMGCFVYHYTEAFSNSDEMMAKLTDHLYEQLHFVSETTLQNLILIGEFAKDVSNISKN